MTAKPEPGVFSPVHARPTGNRRKALFLDRDGVINVNHGYVHTPEQTEWVPGIFGFCRVAQEVGYALVVVTNQAGIARGYYSEEQFLAYTRWVHEEFQARSILLEATYYCPHHAEAGVGQYQVECECRKPRPGMILRAAYELGLDLRESVLVGDMESDLAAARAAGVASYYLIGQALNDPASVLGVAAP